MGASEVFVFGSAARNELRPESDVDIAVRGLPPNRFFAGASQAADALGRPVDLIDLDDRTPTVR
jgi:predicted nucleotidyltransferase